MTLEIQKQGVAQLSNSNLADSRFEVDNNFHKESYPLLATSQHNSVSATICLYLTSIASVKRAVELGSFPYFLKTVGCLT